MPSRVKYISLFTRTQFKTMAPENQKVPLPQPLVNVLSQRKAKILTSEGQEDSELHHMVTCESWQSGKTSYYMVPTTAFWKRQNCGGRDRPWLPGAGRKGGQAGWTGGAQGFWGQWNYSVWCCLYSNTCPYTGVTPHRVHNTMSEPKETLWTLGDNEESVLAHQV